MSVLQKRPHDSTEEEEEEDLPPGWTIKKSKTHNRTYYWNEATQTSSWERPSAMTSSSNATRTTVAASTSATTPTMLSASHLLIKHAGSRNPSSWKESSITRTKEEAIEILKNHQQTLQAASDLKAKFAELASVHSDCSSAKRGGDLGSWVIGKMQPPFEKATLATKIGELSEIVETDSGVHLILRQNV